jgi:hypothetical protein
VSTLIAHNRQRVESSLSCRTWKGAQSLAKLIWEEVVEVDVASALLHVIGVARILWSNTGSSTSAAWWELLFIVANTVTHCLVSSLSTTFGESHGAPCLQLSPLPICRSRQWYVLISATFPEGGVQSSPSASSCKDNNLLLQIALAYRTVLLPHLDPTFTFSDTAIPSFRYRPQRPGNSFKDCTAEMRGWDAYMVLQVENPALAWFVSLFQNSF